MIRPTLFNQIAAIFRTAWAAPVSLPPRSARLLMKFRRWRIGQKRSSKFDP